MSERLEKFGIFLAWCGLLLVLPVVVGVFMRGVVALYCLGYGC